MGTAQLPPHMNPSYLLPRRQHPAGASKGDAPVGLSPADARIVVVEVDPPHPDSPRSLVEVLKQIGPDGEVVVEEHRRVVASVPEPDVSGQREAVPGVARVEHPEVDRLRARDGPRRSEDGPVAVIVHHEQFDRNAARVLVRQSFQERTHASGTVERRDHHRHARWVEEGLAESFQAFARPGDRSSDQGSHRRVILVSEALVRRDGLESSRAHAERRRSGQPLEVVPARDDLDPSRFRRRTQGGLRSRQGANLRERLDDDNSAKPRRRGRGERVVAQPEAEQDQRAVVPFQAARPSVCLLDWLPCRVDRDPRAVGHQRLQRFRRRGAGCRRHDEAGRARRFGRVSHTPVTYRPQRLRSRDRVHRGRFEGRGRVRAWSAPELDRCRDCTSPCSPMVIRMSTP